MKIFTLLMITMFLVACGTVNNDTEEDVTPGSEVDVTLPVEDFDDAMPSDLEDDAWSDDGADWGMQDIEAEWQEARDRSADFDFTWLSEDEASELASSNNIPFRVVMRDDEMLPVTMDYVPGRINAQVENGIVTSVSVE